MIRTSTINQLAEAHELAVAEGDGEAVNLIERARARFINLDELLPEAEELLISLGIRG